MNEALSAWMRSHWDELMAKDYAEAAKLGAPKGFTLSGYAWKLEMEGKPWGKIWRPRIDRMWLALFNKQDHCKGAYARDLAASVTWK